MVKLNLMALLGLRIKKFFSFVPKLKILTISNEFIKLHYEVSFVSIKREKIQF